MKDCIQELKKRGANVVLVDPKREYKIQSHVPSRLTQIKGSENPKKYD
jgi:hypothetical protein